ncbi:hypothetical protein [Streptomyces sp. 5-10]|uniref:hypothetical protein n=1 Tax=Streptomyces sp. 5-10 TaxID=878925 RepID=UPI00168AA87F|nr:hypothetical protein [Streptomyces sp. 5-10]MBD3004677.1 hypothetical protein [Streptomyces sp. 5-10]
MSGPVSASAEFRELAGVIDPRIPSDRAAELMVAFRDVVRSELLHEIADYYERKGCVVLAASQVAAEPRSGEIHAGKSEAPVSA